MSVLLKRNLRSRFRAFLLLEVLIAFSIVVLAVLPLIYPHYYIYQQQHAFVNKINLDIAVGQIYTKILEKLYRNEILWGEIEQQRVFPIDESLIGGEELAKALPYEGSYQLRILKSKKNERFSLNLVEVTLRFIQKPAPHKGENSTQNLIYTYENFIAQQLGSLESGQQAPNAGKGERK